MLKVSFSSARRLVLQSNFQGLDGVEGLENDICLSLGFVSCSFSFYFLILYFIFHLISWFDYFRLVPFPIRRALSKHPSKFPCWVSSPIAILLVQFIFLILSFIFRFVHFLEK
jgi:hypothetical protein